MRNEEVAEREETTEEVLQCLVVSLVKSPGRHAWGCSYLRCVRGPSGSGPSFPFQKIGSLGFGVHSASASLYGDGGCSGDNGHTGHCHNRSHIRPSTHPLTHTYPSANVTTAPPDSSIKPTSTSTGYLQGHVQIAWGRARWHAGI